MPDKAWPYEDIVTMKRPLSAAHEPMRPADRAAQFSPFAALSGYEACVKETARLTDRRAALSEDALRLLDKKLRLLQEAPDNREPVQVVHFVADEKKEGGAYRTVSGRFKRIDADSRRLLLEDGTAVPIADIYDITGACFSATEDIETP